jgi:hypothetical protein
VQFWIASVRLADLDESAAHVAVMLTDAGLGVVAGAVYKAVPVPVVVIVPTDELPFGTPLTAQFTLVLAFPVLVTVATNWTIPVGNTVDMAGGLVATVTPRMPDGGGGAGELFPPQLPKIMSDAEDRSATTATTCALVDEHLGNDTRGLCLALASVMVSSIHGLLLDPLTMNQDDVLPGE